MPKEIDTDRIPPAAFDKIKDKLANKPAPINNTDLVLAFKAIGGRVMHIRPGRSRPRGMTIAFIQKNGRIEVATAVQHRVDDFTKKIGTKTAVEHFNAGKTVTLPFSGGRDDDWKLQDVFRALCYS